MGPIVPDEPAGEASAATVWAAAQTDGVGGGYPGGLSMTGLP